HGRWEGDGEGDGQHNGDDDHAVPHVFEKEGARDRVAKVLQRERRREPFWSQGKDVAAWLERRGDHPVDREEHQRRDGDPGRVEQQLFGALPQIELDVRLRLSAGATQLNTLRGAGRDQAISATLTVSLT